MPFLKNRSILIGLAFFSVYVFWGSTYLFNKVAVTELPPFMLAATRFIVAGLLLLIIGRFMGYRLTVTTRQLANCGLAGILFLTYGNGVFVSALRYVDSGLAALEVSAQPLIVLLLMRLLYGKRIQLTSYIGVAMGMLGIYLLVSQQQIVQREDSLVAMLVIMSCVFSWGVGSLFVAKADLPNFIINTAYQMIIGGSVMAAISVVLKEEWRSPLSWSVNTQLAMIGLIVLGSIVAFTAFNYLLKIVSPEKVATATYINPIIALFLGWYFLDEVITTQSLVAATVLLTGVYFINAKPGAKLWPGRMARRA